jgi:hypothetical protein
VELWRSTNGSEGVSRGRFSTPILYSRGGHTMLILRMGVAGGRGNECHVIVIQLPSLEDLRWMGIHTDIVG